MYRTDFWTLGEGEGGMFRENSIETCILSRVKYITSLDWMHEDKCSVLVYWEDPEGWGGEGGGRGIGMENICKSMVDSCQCMTKNTIL